MWDHSLLICQIWSIVRCQNQSDSDVIREGGKEERVKKLEF